MQKVILITGSTDGIGLATAEMLISQGHHVLLHGRNAVKLAEVEKTLSELPGDGHVDSYIADLSRLTDVESLAKEIAAKHTTLDVLINNAGIYNVPDPAPQDGPDLRFLVNAIAPYLLTQWLLPLLGSTGRVINLSSAAQSPVDLEALGGKIRLPDDFTNYAQSKLALTMWSRSMALSLMGDGPAIIAINPGSMLGSKMVKQAFGVEGSDIRIGAEILCRAALSDEFAIVSGQYFDNDSGRFTSPHPDVLDPEKTREVIRAIEAILTDILEVQD